MIIHTLMESDTCIFTGCGVSHITRYYVDGKRATESRFRQLKYAMDNQDNKYSCTTRYLNSGEHSRFYMYYVKK